MAKLLFLRTRFLRNADPYDSPAFLPVQGVRALTHLWTVRVGVGALLLGIAVTAATPLLLPAFGPLLPVSADTSEILSQIPGQSDASQGNAAILPALSKAPPRLIIKKIGVNIAIVEGKNESVLMAGAWRSPWSSTPDQGGNTVIFGHRWRYRPPNPETFYSLDKLAVGDVFTVAWNGKMFTYTVVEVKIIDPHDLSVLTQTARPSVTLITCTPLYTTTQRLVVRGELTASQ